jgi:uncharacterized protein (TIGR03083 family)
VQVLPAPDEIDLGVEYRRSRERLSDLVLGVTDAASVPVAACPGWTVHDVVCHLVAVVEDVMAGRLTGPPDDAETAAQVGRRRDRPTPGVVDEWAAIAPPFEDLLAKVRVWPAAMDVLSHEQDIRAAVGQPGARDAAGILVGAGVLVDSLRGPVDLLIHVDDAEHVIRSGQEAGGEPLELRTTAFEAFRFRLGRRSRGQLAAMAWSGDPSALIPDLTIFGPSPTDILE